MEGWMNTNLLDCGYTVHTLSSYIDQFQTEHNKCVNPAQIYTLNLQHRLASDSIIFHRKLKSSPGYLFIETEVFRPGLSQIDGTGQPYLLSLLHQFYLPEAMARAKHCLQPLPDSGPACRFAGLRRWRAPGKAGSCTQRHGERFSAENTEHINNFLSSLMCFMCVENS